MEKIQKGTREISVGQEDDPKMTFKRSRSKKKSKEVPADVLIEIFQYLDTDDLLSVGGTCRLWHAVIKENPEMWLYNVNFSGDLYRMKECWNFIHRKQRHDVPAVHSVTFRHTALELLEMEGSWYFSMKVDSDVVLGSLLLIWEREFLKSLPFEKIRYIDYEGCNGLVDSLFWRSLKRCRMLQSFKLKLTSSLASQKDPDHRLPSFDKFNDPIAGCKLEELEITVSRTIFLLNLRLDHLKRLVLNTILDAGNVQSYIYAAKDSLKELQLCAVRHVSHLSSRTSGRCKCGTASSLETDSNEDLPAFILPKLKSFKAIWSTTEKNVKDEKQETNAKGKTDVAFNMKAPNLIQLTYNGFRGWDRTLFDSCCHNLKFLEVDINDHNSKCVKTAISKLVNCEKLTLRHAFPKLSKSRKAIGMFKGDYTSSDTTPCKALVMLEELTIIDDVHLNVPEICRFVAFKLALPSSKYQQLSHLSLQGCPKLASLERSYLGQNLHDSIPHFSLL